MKAVQKIFSILFQKHIKLIGYIIKHGINIKMIT